MATLLRFVVVKSVYNNKYLSLTDCKYERVPEGYMKFDGDEVGSPTAKFALEISNSTENKDKGLMHIRSCFNNRYMVRNLSGHEGNCWIVAAAKHPEEDESNISCTLFKMEVDQSINVRFRHVQSGKFACLWRVDEPMAAGLYIGSEMPDRDYCDLYTLVNWETGIKVTDMNPSRLEEATSSDLVQKFLGELGLKPYSHWDLKKFTSNFSESNKIGSGGYGDVYQGQFPCGLQVAVKVLATKDVVEEIFMAEISTMGKAYHRNLVKLYGYCFEHNMKALVFEYMENGSLDKILYENHHGGIDWETLYSIAVKTARGLLYLHDGGDERIIHYDIKAGNVLLDKNFSPRITDFGLAKLVKRDITHVSLTRTRGTQGYSAPETWFPGSHVTYKCDVYSFGMMLFEILGKRSNGEGENWFPEQVWKKFNNGQLDQLIKDCGITEKDRGKAKLLSMVALWCSQYNPDIRPSMNKVVMVLENEILVKKPPCPFQFGQSSSFSMLPSILELVPEADESCILSINIMDMRNASNLEQNFEELLAKMANLNRSRDLVKTRKELHRMEINGWLKNVKSRERDVEELQSQISELKSA